MPFWSCQPPRLPTSATEVIAVDWIYFRQRRRIDKQETLYLVKDSSRMETPYEIIFRVRRWILPDRYYSVWRFADRHQARDRFHLMDRLVKAVYYKSSTYRRDAQRFLQRLVRAMAERPAWREVHIAARNGYDEYFTHGTLEPALLNEQHLPDEMTPLHVAILYGFPAIVTAILKQNSNIALFDAEGNTVLHYAALTGHQDILQAILQVPGIRALLVRNENHWNPIELVCFGENEIKDQQENLKIFLKCGLTVRLLTMVSKPGRSIHPSLIAWLAELDDEHWVKLTDADLMHLNLAAARRGGCPLHWATDASLIEHLLASGFNVDTPNIDGDRPLGLAIKRGDVKCTLALLCHDANTNLLNKSGDAPLHLAIQVGNAQLVKLVIIFGADINLRDAMDRSPRHLAATRALRPILSLLLDMKATQCEPGAAHCVRGCWKEFPKSKMKPSPFNFHLKHRTLAEEILAGQIEAPRGKLEMMACFDGGGIRGLFTVQAMIELSKYLKHPFYHYFDWLSGTSTGAMIAWALSTGRSLSTIRRLYFTLKDQVFIGSKPFEAAHLEGCLQAEFGATMTLRDALPGKRVLIFATLVKRSPPGLQIFRNYPRPDDTARTRELNRWPAWMALRASTAAPTYFHSFKGFIDGGLLANNPTIDTLTEYYCCPAKSSLQSNLKLVLSFGTGKVESNAKANLNKEFDNLEVLRQFWTLLRHPTKVFSLSSQRKQIQAITTQCNDHIISRADSWCASVKSLFYRINPQQMEKVALDETSNAKLIKELWQVKIWSLEHAEQLKRLAAVLEVLLEAKMKMQN